MSKEEKQSSAELQGAVGGKDVKETLVLGSEPPTTEEYPASPINGLYPDTIEGMENYRKTLMKYLDELRDLLKRQKEWVQKNAEMLGIPWDKYIEDRKENLRKKLRLTLRCTKDQIECYTKDWKEENFLPECSKTVADIQWIHLCRWTLHKSIEKFYIKNETVTRIDDHKASEHDVSAHERDSNSHVTYLVNKQVDQELLEKESCLLFGQWGASVMSERQIRALEKVVGHKLGTEESKYAQHWTEKAIEMTREVSDQTLADMPSLASEDSSDKSKTGSNSESSTSPSAPCPYILAFDMLRDLKLDRRDTLSGIPGLPTDSPTAESPIDQSEEASSIQTGEGTDDEATSPEDNTQRRKLYLHKSKPHRDDGDVADTE